MFSCSHLYVPREAVAEQLALRFWCQSQALPHLTRQQPRLEAIVVQDVRGAEAQGGNLGMRVHYKAWHMAIALHASYHGRSGWLTCQTNMSVRLTCHEIPSHIISGLYEREDCTALLSLCGLTDPTVSCSPTNLCKCFLGPYS
jgi:hypothetical protein